MERKASKLYVTIRFLSPRIGPEIGAADNRGGLSRAGGLKRILLK